METTVKFLSRTVHVLRSVVVFAFLAELAFGQCGSPTFLRVHHLWRVGFNEIEALAGTQVVGDFWYNWNTSVSSAEYRNGSLLHYGTASGTGDLSSVQWNDAPSSVGVGTFTTSNFHSAQCGSNYTSSSSGDSLAVVSPTISNLPYNNSLWYFGSGTPDAVPIYGGYAYQYADLTFVKNCNPGDTCSGSPSWSKVDPSGLISITSGGRLKSAAGGTCGYDSAVTATLSGWQIAEPIMVNSPEFLAAPRDPDTRQWNSGYQTWVYWVVADACSPANAVPSVALYETFGAFHNPGVISGWTDPTATGASGYNFDTYTFYDAIGAWGSYNPTPTFTSQSPPYTYNSIIKYASQSWFVGTQSVNSGRRVFLGTIEYYRDHGDSHY
jgi:hypothetical protein